LGIGGVRLPGWPFIFSTFTPIMHLGQKIKEIFESRDISVVDFARQIGTVRQNVYRIFEREAVDTDLLMRISESLDHNFFQYFRPRVSLPLSFTETSQNPEPVITEVEDANLPAGPELVADAMPTCNPFLSAELYQRELDMAHKEIEYLKKIVSLLEERTVYLVNRRG
jgi:transcriptional regulator with XRE-family HTH domain